MARTTLIKFFSIATLLLAVAVFSFMPAKSTYAQGGGVLQQSAATGTAFTYQGSLIKSGTGVSDTCNFNFTLYDALSGGNVVGSPVAKNSVSISNGIFTVDLDFGGTAFDGNARYLDIQVQCTGDASMQQLSPRTALNGTPYALSLRPGAVISGSVASGSSLEVVNSDNSTSYGIHGQTDSDTNASAGVYGTASSTSAKVYGVYGKVDTSHPSAAGVEGYSTTGTASGVRGTSVGNGGVGVYGYSDSGLGVLGVSYGTNTNNAGIFGEARGSTGVVFGVGGTTASNSTGAAGVYGSASSTNGVIYGVLGETSSTSNGASGVKGETTAASGSPYGVYGLASDTGAVTSYGVYGESKSSVGTGVGGISPFNGVYGEASATSGTTYGVYGKSDSSSGYGVYSSGNAHVEGLLTWKAITSYLSIPPAAFNPLDNSSTYDKGSWFVAPGTTGTPATTFMAPVYLPHGATITKMTWHWTDTSASDGSAILYRQTPSTGFTLLAQVLTSGNSGYASSTDLTIDNATVDNSQYSYFIWLSLPDSNVVGQEVFIEYTITQPY